MIDKIYVDKQVVDYPHTKAIIEQLNNVNIEYFDDIDKLKKDLSHLKIDDGKRCIVLTEYKGKMVKQCPATNETYLCCKYIIINHIVNCPLDCSYCILQSYTNTNLITIYVNTNQIFDELEQLSNNNPNRIFRLGTGELSDSLALDNITGFSKELISYCSSKKNLILELKSKSINVNNLLKIKNVPSNIVVSWSVNPQPIIDGEEFRTASIKKRLEMAQTLSEIGYKIGFHFDPILFYHNWKSIYIDLVDNIFQYVKPENIIWISLGAFRYIQGLKEVIQERFKSSNIIYSEQIKGNDGKMRYPKPIRIEMFREIYNRIRKHSQDVFVYFCMEDKTVWNNVMGFAPSNNDELDLMFESSIKRKFKL